MPRRNGGGSRATTRQKGLRNRNRRNQLGKISNYCRLNKRQRADRYDRPYLTGNYRKDQEW